MWTTRLWKLRRFSFFCLLLILSHAGCDGRYLDGTLTHRASLPPPNKKLDMGKTSHSNCSLVAVETRLRRCEKEWEGEKEKCLIKIPWHDQHGLIRNDKVELLFLLPPQCQLYEYVYETGFLLNIEYHYRQKQQKMKKIHPLKTISAQIYNAIEWQFEVQSYDSRHVWQEQQQADEHANECQTSNPIDGQQIQIIKSKQPAGSN